MSFWQQSHTREENKEREIGGGSCSSGAWICPIVPQTSPCTLPDNYIGIPKYIQCADRSCLLNVHYLKAQLTGSKRRKDINLFCCCFHWVGYWYTLCCFLSSWSDFKLTELLHSPAHLLICFRKKLPSPSWHTAQVGFMVLIFFLTFWVIL